MEQAVHWLVGALGVPLINWLKRVWGLSGKGAMWLTLAVAVILGAGSLLLSRQWDWRELTAEELLAVVGQVLAAATLAYNLLKGE